MGIWRALERARAPIAWMALTYVGSVAVGAGMAHAGNGLVLRYRDRLVGHAGESGAGGAMRRNERVQAALLDFGSNLLMGAVPSTVMGISVVMPFPLAAYRGWVGGIVSVDGQHVSRFANRREGIYYLGVLLLQLIPYTLAGGAEVRLGLGFLLPRGRWGYADHRRWLGLPAEGVRDVGWLYLLVVPLFLVASLVEFLAR